ncbi:hypothetical protein [Methylophaga nitratireducenticrescens]|uniref:hypothetical protein n=1 Tax=Methylophaga nitratireducenticrescens TaxID=754476 RepID=UPI000CDC62BF|nr:hypothetical protein [Methylophaga nitratireducenticrescens]AUZ84771.1 hypothetical protein CDW43_09370 [Methylophaga nitratireducenticrescens]
MTELRCIDKEGSERIYLLTCDYDPHKGEFDYRVYSNPLPSSGGFFELSVKEVGDELQVISMNHNHMLEYKAKGIPDALLLYIAKHSGKSVRSSPAWGKGGEFRSTDATKVWDRLVAKNMALYFESEDLYRVSEKSS